MDSPLQEYPALLVSRPPRVPLTYPPFSHELTDDNFALLLQASLQPSQAANVLNDRLKVMNKVNSDIADWLQVRLDIPPPLRSCPLPSNGRGALLYTRLTRMTIGTTTCRRHLCTGLEEARAATDAGSWGFTWVRHLGKLNRNRIVIELVADGMDQCVPSAVETDRLLYGIDGSVA